MEHLRRYVFPVSVALLAVVGAWAGDPTTATRVAAALAVVVLAAALVARPLAGWPLIACLLLFVVLVTLACADDAGNLGWFGICVLAGWAGLVEPPRLAIPLALVAVGMFVLQQVVLAPDDGWGAWIGGTAISAMGSMAGRRERQLVDQLRAAQAGLADRARAEERTRIAHELHDVIGHALTVSVMHVTSARLALDEDPAEAAAALAEAERLSRQSLAEVRAVVGLMRDTESTAPMPGTAELGDLVDSFRNAGADVDWRVEGDLAALTAAEGLVVYRIVQESLTNVVRHAAGAPVAASVTRAANGTRVVVDSGGPPPRVVLEGGGVAGMRHRAEAVGGRLTAGPGGTGWVVEALIP